MSNILANNQIGKDRTLPGMPAGLRPSNRSFLHRQALPVLIHVLLLMFSPSGNCRNLLLQLTLGWLILIHIVKI